jgi:hypothetical protein
MTSEAASTPPRKRSWKPLIVALACVAAVTIIALLANTPKNEPVTVRFVRSTNEMGEKKLVFEGTNGLPRGIMYSALVTMTSAAAVRTGNWSPLYHDPAYGVASPGRPFKFSLDAPPKDTDWGVLWGFSEHGHAPTRWEKVRTGCSLFLTKHGMRTLARHFADPGHTRYIPATDLKE